MKSVNVNIESAVLHNGLRVIMVPSDRIPNVGFFTFVKAGSRNERPGITGISHIFEHMMFKGSSCYAEGEFDAILHANGGYSNAYTTKDYTAYYEIFPNNLIDKVLDMEVDRLVNLNISEASLESERQVIIEERLMRVDNNVEGFLQEQIYANSYLAHPYSWPVIGWMSDIEAITLSQCLEYHKIYYAPNNMIVVISGDFNPRSLLPKIEKAYAGVPRQIAPPRVITREPAITADKYIYLRKNANMNQYVISFPVLSASDADLYALDVMQVILSNGASSRINDRIVEKERAAIAQYGAFGYSLDTGLFTQHFHLPGDGTFDRVESLFNEEIERFLQEGPSEREIQKAKNMLRVDFVQHLLTLEDRGHEVGKAAVYFGSGERIMETIERYDRISMDDVRRVAERFLTQPKIHFRLLQENRES